MALQKPILRRVEYDGDGISKLYDIGFIVHSEDQVVVIKTNYIKKHDTLKLGVDYTVDVGLGSVMLASALSVGDSLTILNNHPVAREIAGLYTKQPKRGRPPKKKE